MSSKSPKLLIVDDDPDVRAMMATMLAASGIRVESTASGKDALTKVFSAWEGESYAGILLDCALPVLDGPTVALLIREQEEKRERAPMKIGFCTAYGEEVEMGRFPAKVHATFYARKPVDIDELAAGLHRWLRSEV